MIRRHPRWIRGAHTSATLVRSRATEASSWSFLREASDPHRGAPCEEVLEEVVRRDPIPAVGGVGHALAEEEDLHRWDASGRDGHRKAIGLRPRRQECRTTNPGLWSRPNHRQSRANRAKKA